MKFDVRVQGPEDVKRILGEIAPREAHNLMRATVQGIASEIGKDAKAGAPVGDSGNLRDSIKAKRRNTRDRGRIQSDVLAGGGGAFYWRFQEYGTSALAAVGFFLAAVEKLRGELTEVYLRVFTKKLIAALKRARKRNGG